MTQPFWSLLNNPLTSTGAGDRNEFFKRELDGSGDEQLAMLEMTAKAAQLAAMRRNFIGAPGLFGSLVFGSLQIVGGRWSDVFAGKEVSCYHDMGYQLWPLEASHGRFCRCGIRCRHGEIAALSYS